MSCRFYYSCSFVHLFMLQAHTISINEMQQLSRSINLGKIGMICPFSVLKSKKKKNSNCKSICALGSMVVECHPWLS